MDQHKHPHHRTVGNRNGPSESVEDMKIQPGTAGTVDSKTLSSFTMGDGSGKPTTIIKDGTLFRYVGIGWVEIRKATQADADQYPVVVYPESTVEHRITV